MHNILDDRDKKELNKSISEVNTRVDASMVADETTGNNPTAGNSTDGNVIYLKDAGYTEQKTLIGKNLFGFGKSAVDKTNEYRTNAGQRVVISSIDGNLNAIKCKYNGGSYSFGYVSIEGIDGTQKYKFSYTVSENTTSYTPRIIKDTAHSNENQLVLTIDGGNNENVVSTSNYFVLSDIQVELGETATDYEPYCGGVASPNPDYPQHIGASADKGYFDGELRQGLYLSADGSFSSATHFICSANKISCKENDSIVVQYEKNVKNIRATFYKVDGTFISTLGVTNIDTNKIEVIAPTESDYFYISIGLSSGDSLLVADAKHICVTINGMYALRVKSGNKNVASKVTYLSMSNDYGSLLKDVGANIQKGKTYTVSIDLTASSDTQAYWSKNSGVLADNAKFTVKSGTNRYYHTFVASNDLTESDSKIFLSKSGTGDGVAIQSANLQIEENSTMTDYEPHQETEALIPVSAPLYDGDYIEVYADGTGQIVRENGVSDNLTFYSQNQNIMTLTKEARYYNPTDMTTEDYTPFYCNMGTWVRSTWGTDNAGICSNAGSNGEFVSLRVPIDTDASTLSPKIVYKLAEPVIEPITAEQVAEFMKLQTFNPVTHVTADGEVTVRYYFNNDNGDTVSMISKQIETLDNKIDELSTYGGCRKCGTWIDGKPLYWQVFNMVLSANKIPYGFDYLLSGKADTYWIDVGNSFAVNNEGESKPLYLTGIDFGITDTEILPPSSITEDYTITLCIKYTKKY